MYIEICVLMFLPLLRLENSQIKPVCGKIKNATVRFCFFYGLA